MPFIHKILQPGILVTLLLFLTGCQSVSEGQALPSGAEIVFSSWRDHNLELYKLSSTDLHNLTQSPSQESFPVWSPDGEQLAFLLNENGQQHLALMDADGRNTHVLVENVLALDEPPVWARDGQMIAFACSVDKRTTLCLVSPGGGWVQIMPGEWASLGSIQWSPTDPLLLFHATSGSAQDIFAYTTYSNRVHNLTHRPGQDRSPAWSPDGRTIAFISDHDGRSGLYLMNIDGTHPRFLLEASMQNGLHWSPDGKYIAFTQAAVGRTHVCTFQLDGRAQYCAQGSGRSPSWSPDGQFLVYEARLNTHSNIYLTDRECKATRRLTTDSAGSFTPHWRPEAPHFQGPWSQ